MVIDVHRDIAGGTVNSASKHTTILNEVLKPKPLKEGRQRLIPDTRSLFQPVQAFQEFAYKVLLTRDFETFRLCHVDLLLKEAVKKCRFDIHLVDFKIEQSCDCEKEPEYLHPDNGGEDFVVVNAIFLEESFDHQTRFEAVDGACDGILHYKDPSAC